jgi:general secretion pathway protein A
MYTEFYQLTDQPFQLTPDHRFFYGSSVHKRAMAHLTFGLSQGEGFIVITGDVGAGKTTLMGHLLATLDRDRYVTGTIVTTQLGGDDMLRMVAAAFDLEHENADKATLLLRIEERFKGFLAEGKHCLLLVDEVQNLSFQALEELRMLSNFQIDGKAMLQSFLLGQPQFRRTLASQDLDQLRQRVIASYHLGPVGKQEIRAYIEHRLKAVGWSNDPEITEDAYAEIFEHTGGVPRKINVLCSRILLFGFLEEEHRIDRASVIQVAEDLFRETELILDHGGQDATPSPQVDTPPPAPAAAEPAPVQPQVAAPPPAEPEPVEPVAQPVSNKPPPPPPPRNPLEAQPTAETPQRLDAPAPDEAAPEISNPDILDQRAPEPETMVPKIAAPEAATPDETIDEPAPNVQLIDAAHAVPVVIHADGGEIEALQQRLSVLEVQFERHERMLRWTQLMLKHHERLIRRRAQGVITRA